MTTPFWSNDPTILFNKDNIFQLWPTPKMTFEEKLNAISRLVLFLTIIGFIFLMSTKFLFVGIGTLIIIFILYKTRKQKIIKGMVQEGFSINNAEAQVHIDNPETLEKFLKSDFEQINKKNPLGNMLLTQIGDNPQRKSAPPSFNTMVYEDINNTTKKMIQSLNPGIKNTNKQLFGDLGEKFEFDQSMWQYYSMPNTKVGNDQGAYADYLYGGMISGKEDALARVQDNYRYTLN